MQRYDRMKSKCLFHVDFVEFMSLGFCDEHTFHFVTFARRGTIVQMVGICETGEYSYRRKRSPFLEGSECGKVCCNKCMVELSF